jgi:hypothetical protein
MILQGKGIFVSSGHVPVDEAGNLITERPYGARARPRERNAVTDFRW